MLSASVQAIERRGVVRFIENSRIDGMKAVVGKSPVFFWMLIKSANIRIHGMQRVGLVHMLYPAVIFPASWYLSDIHL